VKFADQAVCIGPPPSRQSYLNVPMISSAAEITGADAVHPGYGFLSENADFAEVCRKCKLAWIGPPPDAMRLMGDKIRAREAMANAGVPVLPGSAGLHVESDVLEAAERIGYPIILKATAGGGGRGMKIIFDKDKLIESWAMGRTEAQAAFGNPEMYMERYCEKPRHIEIQVVADKHGHYTHLGERECSIQRRHQKVIEEARRSRCRGHTRAAHRCRRARDQAIGYTRRHIGFLLDADGKFFAGDEHAPAGQASGDRARDRPRSGARANPHRAGEPLVRRAPSARSAIELGSAPRTNTFAPWPGKITALHMPGGLGVRVDTHVYAGYVVPPNYDSLLAKVIVHDVDRPAALRRARRCLDEMVIEGIRTNIPFLRRIVNNPDFIRGDFDTGFVGRLLADRASAA
jgi:acetyl-CoA carboxylase biotin carboxylase subunit